MLLLYQEFLELVLRDKRLYIPLCFYFIRTRTRGGGTPCRLYIPLCFYFITVYTSSKTGFRPLHSIMLLLYQDGSLGLLGLHFIYIPLCFYFIEKDFRFYRISTWSTFHYASTLSANGSIGTTQYYTSTFHYASTLSIDTRLEISSLVISTFHYASTLSFLVPHLMQSQWNLHSIMLLLYRQPGVNFPPIHPIYIPLCFYFIFLLAACKTW